MQILKIHQVGKWLSLVILLVTNHAFAAVPERSNEDIARDKTSKGQAIIEMAKITPGMKVLDLLGGSGYYSELLAASVGHSGLVYLHNNKAYMPYVEKQLVERLKDKRLPNVRRFDKELGDLDFADENFDAVFFVLGYHDIYHVTDGWKVDRDALLKQLQLAVKKGGKLVIIDHAAKAETGTKDSQDLHRIDKQYVINELTSLGFVLDTDSNLLANPDDDHTLTPFEPSIRRKTDRFVLIFTKA
ncbi:class I SAM-dependent methyltransferase [Colwellia sp. MEBiC06753]